MSSSLTGPTSPYRLVVRMPDSQSGDQSSTLCGGTSGYRLTVRMPGLQPGGWSSILHSRTNGSGETADTQSSNLCAARREGSTPSFRTNEVSRNRTFPAMSYREAPAMKRS